MRDSASHNRAPVGAQSGRILSLINKEYRKGYTVPYLDHQTYGIAVKNLWTKNDSKLRIIPGYDPKTGELYKQNILVDEYSEETPLKNFLSDTFMMANVVTRWGDAKSTFITDLPDSEAGMYECSPINYFYATVFSAVSKKRGMPFWADWFSDGVHAYGGKLTRPRESLIFQALAYKVNDRYTTGPDNTPILDENGNPVPLDSVIIIDHQPSASALIDALVVPQSRMKPLDASTNNDYGALAEARGNMLYMNSAPYNDTNSRRKAGEQSRYLRPSVQEPSVKGWNPEPLDLDEEVCRNLWIPWEKLLHYYTAEEQLFIIAEDFGADTVNYVFANKPAFSGLIIPDKIAEAGLGRYASGTVSDSATVYMSATSKARLAAASAGIKVAERITPQETAVKAPVRASFGAKPTTTEGSNGVFKAVQNTSLSDEQQGALSQLRAAMAKKKPQAEMNTAQLASSIVGDDFADDVDSEDNFPGLDGQN